MKTFIALFAMLSVHKAATCQSTTPTYPNVLLTEQQLNEKMLLSRIGNYDNEIGRFLGEFSAVCLNGKAISQKDLIGKVSFVNFWFDACSPCHALFAPLNALYKRYKGDSNFQVISFTLDNPQTLEQNVAKYGLLYQNISIQDSTCRKLMGMYRGFSCTYIVDQQGKIVFGHSGGSSDGFDVFQDAINPKIDSLLKNKFVPADSRLR
jgi:cytochrome oxidase Cu insertion factor (SCO1/SenC/PrrC family)